MRKIKVAQIGVGHDHAGMIMHTMRQQQDLFDVVGYAEVPEDEKGCPWMKKHLDNQSVLYQGVKQYTVEEIFAMSDLDALVIETHDTNLIKYAQMAADRGFSFHMDKAPGESAEDFEKLLSTVKAKKLAFSIGYMYRFNPLIRQAIERVKNGDFGAIHSIEAEMSCFYQKDKRDWLSSLQGGMMQYLGCHLVDLVVRILGVPEKIVPFVCSTGYQGTKGKDFALAVFQYPNGASTVKSVMGDYGGYVRRHVLINGANASMDIRPLEQAEPVDMSSNSYFYNKENWGDLGEKTYSGLFSRYGEMTSAFAAMVRGERGLEVDLETEARVHRCLLAADGLDVDYKGEIKL